MASPFTRRHRFAAPPPQISSYESSNSGQSSSSSENDDQDIAAIPPRNGLREAFGGGIDSAKNQGDLGKEKRSRQSIDVIDYRKATDGARGAGYDARGNTDDDDLYEDVATVRNRMNNTTQQRSSSSAQDMFAALAAKKKKNDNSKLPKRRQIMDRLPSLPETNADMNANPPAPPARAHHTTENENYNEHGAENAEPIYEAPVTRSESHPYARAHRVSQVSNNSYTKPSEGRNDSSARNSFENKVEPPVTISAAKPYQHSIREYLASQTLSQPPHHQGGSRQQPTSVQDGWVKSGRVLAQSPQHTYDAIQQYFCLRAILKYHDRTSALIHRLGAPANLHTEECVQWLEDNRYLSISNVGRLLHVLQQPQLIREGDAEMINAVKKLIWFQNRNEQ
eukprot:m.382753 g.382753  ORF g.382753 m.382753 type:complete len:394 (-) comp20976_c0_seq10:196-1377(-)